MFKFIKDKGYWKLLLQNIKHFCFITFLFIYGMIIYDFIIGKTKFNFQNWGGMILFPIFVFIASYIEYLFKKKEKMCLICNIKMEKHEDESNYFYICYKCGYKYFIKTKYPLEFKWHNFWMKYHNKRSGKHWDKIKA